MLKKTISTTLVIVAINCAISCHNSSTVETFRDTSFSDEFTPFICEFDTVAIKMMQAIKANIKDTVMTPGQADQIRKYMQHMRRGSNDTTISLNDIKYLYQKINPLRRIYATIQSIKFADQNGDTLEIQSLRIK